jgi:hypothetical protein
MYRKGQACSACPSGTRCSTTNSGLCVGNNRIGQSGDTASITVERARDPETSALKAGLGLGAGLGEFLVIHQLLEMQQRRINADLNTNSKTPAPATTNSP